jgi:hypothetical protein
VPVPAKFQNSLSVTNQNYCGASPPKKSEFTPQNNPPENFVVPVPAKFKTVFPHQPKILWCHPPQNNLSLLLETIRPKILRQIQNSLSVIIHTVCPSPPIANQPTKNIVLPVPQNNMSILLKTIRPKIL